MFTFRAHTQSHGDEDSYSTYQAVRYHVSEHRGYKSISLFESNDDLAAPARKLLVGRQPDALFTVVFVMNAAGKTVDTIR